MIRPFVKKFIENNITNIEQYKWKNITDAWYDSALWNALDYDEEMFNQFIAIMNHIVGVDFLKEAKKARNNTIYSELTAIVEEHIHQALAPARGQYKKNIYTDQLVTLLGFTEKEVIEICDAVVSDLGYNYDENYYYIGEEE